MIALTEQQFQDFQKVIQWEVGTEMPDGRILGDPDRNNKIIREGDARVLAVASRFNSRDKTVLEVGCNEGYHTAQLSRICRHVTAFDVRPHNVVCSLINLFVQDVHNAKVALLDARDLDCSFGTFDIMFHVGVLYHLLDPVAHLTKIADVTDDLILDTHYCRDDTTFERSDLTHGGKSYRAHYFTEGLWQDNRAGVEPYARWLYRDSLLELLKDVGFERVEVISDRLEKSGPRFTVIARKTPQQKMANEHQRIIEVNHELSTAPSNTDIEIAKAREEASFARYEIQETHECIRILQRELENHRNTEQRLTHDLEAIQQSNSWRIGKMIVSPFAALKRR